MFQMLENSAENTKLPENASFNFQTGNKHPKNSFLAKLA